MSEEYPNKMFRASFIAFLIFSALAVADKVPHPDIEELALTGPLIAPSGDVVTGGHFNIEPYFTATATTGSYDSNWHAQSIPTFWNLELQLYLQFGINSWLDFQITPNCSYNLSQGATHWTLNDWFAGFDFQILKQSYESGSWRPSIKMTLLELFPLGKYQHLNPNLHSTDEGGNGSFTTFFGLTLSKIIEVSKLRFLDLRLNFSYQLPAPVHVRGFNAYGGASDTNATIYPAQTFAIDVAFEYTLDLNWALACDILSEWTTRTHSKGYPGTDPEIGTSIVLDVGSGAQFSIAPAIEYNWNQHIGAIIGPWFTIAGRNATQFYSIVTAVNFYY